MVRPYGRHTTMTACFRPADAEMVPQTTRNCVWMVDANIYGMQSVFHVGADENLTAIMHELLACVVAYNREQEASGSGLTAALGFLPEAVRLDSKGLRGQVSFGISLSVGQLREAVIALGKSTYGRPQFMHITEVPGQPVKITLRSGVKIISTVSPNTYTELTSVFVGGFSAAEFRDDTAIPVLCEALGEVTMTGTPYSSRDMPGMYTVTLEYTLMSAPEVKANIARIVGHCTSGQPIHVEDGNYTRVMSISMNESQAAEAYDRIHHKCIRRGGAKEGDNASETLTLLNAQAKVTDELVTQLAAATERIELLTAEQSKTHEELHRGMAAQNIGLEAAFNSANARLDAMATTQGEMKEMKVEAANIAISLRSFMVELPHVMHQALCESNKPAVLEERDGELHLSPTASRGRKGGRGSPGGRGGRSGGGPSDVGQGG